MGNIAGWSIVTATNAATGQAQVFRLRTEKPEGDHVDDLKTALTVKWEYDPKTLFPAGSDKEAIEAFERALDPMSSENRVAELVQVATGGGVREWLYYVTAPQVFVESLNRSLKGHPRYPIKIEWYEDPDWKLWTETLKALEGRIT